MSVVVSVEDIGSCQKRVKVAVPAPAVEAENQRVTQEYRRRAKVPGFRRGKVPLDMVRKRFGEEIEQEVVDRLLPRYWKQAEAEAGLEPLLSPQVENVDLRSGEDLTFVATVDVRPEIELGELGEFELPDPDTSPGDDEVSEALEDLRRTMSTWTDADRPAARGDLVVAKLQRLVGDEESEQAQATTFEVGDEHVWEELTVAATGMSAEQRAEFERAEAESGRVRYLLEVEKVRERELPALDDTFAASVGPFESVAALREEVRNRLRVSKERHREREREKALLDQLCARYQFELPKRVVGAEVEQMLGEYASSLAGQGVDLDRAEIDWQRLAEEVRPRAESRVQARLLVDRIAGESEIEVSEGEFESALANMARARQTSSAALRRDLDQGGRLGELRDQLRREKTVRRLLGEEDGDVSERGSQRG